MTGKVAIHPSGARLNSTKPLMAMEVTLWVRKKPWHRARGYRFRFKQTYAPLFSWREPSSPRSSLRPLVLRRRLSSLFFSQEHSWQVLWLPMGPSWPEPLRAWVLQLS